MVYTIRMIISFIQDTDLRVHYFHETESIHHGKNVNKKITVDICFKS